MPRLAHKLPSYCRHKASGQAVVTLDGRDVYLGSFGSPESKDAYDKAVAEWLARGRSAPPPSGQTPPVDLTVSEVILTFLKQADQHYGSPIGEPTPEVNINIKDAVRPLRRLYGKTPARDFGLLALIAVRDEMVRSGTLARGTISARVGRIRRAFRWAASLEMIPATVPAALATLDALKRGRTPARPMRSSPRRPATSRPPCGSCPGPSPRWSVSRRLPRRRPRRGARSALTWPGVWASFRGAGRTPPGRLPGPHDPNGPQAPGICPPPARVGDRDGREGKAP
jgi:hypothetical protein